MNSRINLINPKQIFAVFTGLIVCAIFSFTSFLFFKQWKSTPQMRQVGEINSFEPLWSRDDVYIPASNKAIYLAAGNNTLFLHGNFDQSQNPRLIGLDIVNGSELWTKSGGGTLTGQIMNMSPNGEHIFIGFDGTGKAIDNSQSGAGRVVAYEINSGDILWTQVISGTRKMEILAANDLATVVDGGSFSKRYYLLDNAFGNPIKTKEKGNQYDEKTFLPSTSFGFLYDSTYPVAENDNYWEEIFRNSSVFLPPIASENVIVFRTEEDNTGYVKVYDILTADELWKSEHVTVGNPAIGEDVVFSLTQSAKLTAQDIETGNEIGSVQFSPSTIELANSPEIVLAADGDTVVVYFGDSQQIFAFRFVPSS